MTSSDTMSSDTISNDTISNDTISNDTVSNTTTGTEQERASMNSRGMIGKIIWTLFLDAGLAVAAYLIAGQLGATMFLALLIGTIVAGLRALYVIVRRRELDAFALFMIATFGVGLLLSLVTGSARFLLAKESISTAVSGLIFLGTLLAGKPMMYYLAQRFGATGETQRREWARLWPTSEGFRSFFRGMTIVWGVAFLIEATCKLILVLTLPMPVTAPVVPFFTPALITVLVIWTVRKSIAAQHRLSAVQPVA